MEPEIVARHFTIFRCVWCKVSLYSAEVVFDLACSIHRSQPPFRSADRAVPVQTRPSAPGPCLVELHDGAIRAQRYVPGDRNRRRVVGAAGGSVRLSALGAEPDHA